MKFFQYNKNNAYNILMQANPQITINTNKDFTTTPRMSAKQILEFIKLLKFDKEIYKDFFKNFETIENYNKMSFMSNYYKLNIQALYDEFIKNISKIYPKEKEIKTNLFMKDSKSLAKVLVFAKPDVKLSSFKTYEKKELDQLIKSNKIILRNAHSYKQGKPNGEVPHIYTVNDVLFSGDQEYILDWLQKNERSTFENLLADLNLETIMMDYKKEYLPSYKKCISYLTECAKTSIIHEQQEIKQMQNKILCSKEAIAGLTNIQKTLVDTSKGR